MPVAMLPRLHVREQYGEGVEGMLPIAFRSSFVQRSYQDWHHEGRPEAFFPRAVDCRVNSRFEEAHAQSEVLGCQ